MSLLLRLAYLAVAGWQVAWLAVLPPPLGARLPWLALLALLPLMLPLRGVMTLQPRAVVWASYLLPLYLAVALMEAWSNPPQRLPALVQAALAVTCLAAVAAFNRRRSRETP